MKSIPPLPENERSVEGLFVSEVRDSVATPSQEGFWRRFFAFSGPAFMVSVGYMDPGNWATDIAGGARFGYRLIWVILLANLMAILLQTLAARFGIATGRDLAQACREYYPAPVTWVLWFICEIAIGACDLAEVIGSAIGLHLLFGLPLIWGVILTAFDVILLLMLQSYGIRKLEAVIVVLVGTIGACFACELFISRPALNGMLDGFVPSGLSGDALFIAIGIIGATVMPHNLYLHSALVQSRAISKTPAGRDQAARFNLIDCVVAMNGAFVVNAAILILAAAAFHMTGHADIASIQDAYALLEPLLGSKLAPLCFAVALLASGQSSTITGTLAGQIVMEGFIRFRMRPWLRRLATRLIAIVPSIIVLWWRGNSGVDSLLIVSQVILSLQLSFAIVPLIHFTRDRRWMGNMITPLWAHILAWISAMLIIGLNLKLVLETILSGFYATGIEGAVVRYLLLPASIFLVPLLIWMIFESRWKGFRKKIVRAITPHFLEEVPLVSFPPDAHKIGVVIETIQEDVELLAHVVPMARASRADIVLISVIESATGRFIGVLADDRDARVHGEYLENLRIEVEKTGLTCKACIGCGEADDEIAGIATTEKIDLIVLGSRGQPTLWSRLFGSTASFIRRSTGIPVFSVNVSGSHSLIE
ncbi:MAG: Nramp family divalent metal transporter [Candidatus Riflebacteria bacterium]|nr:Nramp family divalent metal transporter [Candidatus Riflebacteria bacterium]